MSGAAPEMHSLMEVMSTCFDLTFGWFSKALKSVGTPGRNVGFVFSMLATTSSRSAGVGDQDHRAPPEQCDRQNARRGKDVKQGEVRHEAVFPFHEPGSEPCANLQPSLNQARMGGERSLGDTGRAAGEEDEAGILWLDLNCRSALALVRVE